MVCGGEVSLVLIGAVLAGFALRLVKLHGQYCISSSLHLKHPCCRKEKGSGRREICIADIMLCTTRLPFT